MPERVDLERSRCKVCQTCRRERRVAIRILRGRQLSVSQAMGPGLTGHIRSGKGRPVWGRPGSCIMSVKHHSTYNGAAHVVRRSGRRTNTTKVELDESTEPQDIPRNTDGSESSRERWSSIGHRSEANEPDI